MYMVRGLYVLTDKEKAKRKKAHKDRLSKIKNREYGTSNTLDMNPPNVPQSNQVDPRKKAIREEQKKFVEKQNEVMLTRITTIMAAPPKITESVKEYEKMKKLCNSLRARETYDHFLTVKHNKQFFERLKTVGPYYRKDTWEEEYQRQKTSQRFMRQVHYERPKDYIEPLLLGSARHDTTTGTTTGQSNHINIIRSLRSSHSADGFLEHRKGHSHSQQQQNMRNSSTESLVLLTEDGEGKEGKEHDESGEKDEYELYTLDEFTNDQEFLDASTHLDTNNASSSSSGGGGGVVGGGGGGGGGGSGRPESRHMTSRNSDVNSINTMSSLFHQDLTTTTTTTPSSSKRNSPRSHNPLLDYDREKGIDDNDNDDDEDRYSEDEWNEFDNHPIEKKEGKEDKESIEFSRVAEESEDYDNTDTINLQPTKTPYQSPIDNSIDTISSSTYPINKEAYIMNQGQDDDSLQYLNISDKGGHDNTSSNKSEWIELKPTTSSSNSSSSHRRKNSADKLKQEISAAVDILLAPSEINTISSSSSSSSSSTSKKLVTPLFSLDPEPQYVSKQVLLLQNPKSINRMISVEFNTHAPSSSSSSTTATASSSSSLQNEEQSNTGITMNLSYYESIPGSITISNTNTDNMNNNQLIMTMSFSGTSRTKSSRGQLSSNTSEDISNTINNNSSIEENDHEYVIHEQTVLSTTIEIPSNQIDKLDQYIEKLMNESIVQVFLQDDDKDNNYKRESEDTGGRNEAILKIKLPPITG